MSSSLPAVRIPPADSSDAADSPLPSSSSVDLSTSKFGIGWAPDIERTSIANPPMLLESVDVPPWPQEPYTRAIPPPAAELSDEDTVNIEPPPATAPLQPELMSPPLHPPVPRLSRAFSMPLPSQLGYLRNPRRSPSLLASPRPEAATPSSHLQDLSLELADSVEMAIQTLLQLSPPHLLDPAKEQFSACALQLPTPSVSALLTTMKNLNYMSANMDTFGSEHGTPLPGGSLSSQVSPTPSSPIQEDFDIGELLQAVGDALSGVAAQAGVELVLFHSELAIKHINVKGDECGLSYALSLVVRQVLGLAQRGDTIELGLHIASPPSSSASASPPRPDEAPLLCIFDIAHKFADQDDSAESNADRVAPKFDSIITRRLLSHIGATLKTDLEPKTFDVGRRCELSIVLERGLPFAEPERTPEEQAARQPYPTLELAKEPTIEELTLFGETLRGKKAAFYCSSNSSFAHHLSSYLASWGMDVQHVPTDGLADDAEIPLPLERGASELSAAVDSGYGGSSNGLETDGVDTMHMPPPLPKTSDLEESSFLIIDDEVPVLRRCLLQLRAESSSVPAPLRKRPSLAAHHRPRSSPRVPQAVLSGEPASRPHSAVVIVHFTSLSNYKLVKDVVQSTIYSSNDFSASVPEVLVIPKPAGPRRFLTALYTAVNKPVVDPFFSPIATSPISPAIQNHFPFFHLTTTTSSPGAQARQPPTPRPASRSPRDHPAEHPAAPHPPSPLGMGVGAMEYFSDAAAKLGSAAASGVVIQSPDGRPAGIYFQPQRTRSTSYQRTTEPNARPATDRRRSGTAPTLDQRVNGVGSSATTPLKSPSSWVRNSPLNSIGPLPGTSRASSAVSPYRRDSMNPVEEEAEQDQQTSSVPVRGKSRASSASMAEAPVSAPPTPGTRISSQPARPAAVDPSSPRVMAPSTSVGSDLAASAPSDIEPPPPARPVRKGTEASGPRKSGTPPISPRGPISPTGSTGAKRLGARRATMEGRTPPLASKKGNEIVPPINVLIVEDNPINQTILSAVLKRKKIKFGTANNGREAVEKWRTGSFHLILMDIQMPVMDGIEATKEIRQLERNNNIGVFPSTPPSEGSRTPGSVVSSDSRPSSMTTIPPSPSPFRSSVIIVALTASSLESDRVAALAAGCNDFLTKPVSREWLDKKIIEWGSIKALQMWADPEMSRNFVKGQVEKAKEVASHLRISRSPGRRTPSPSTRDPTPIRPSVDVNVIAPTPPAHQPSPLHDHVEADDGGAHADEHSDISSASGVSGEDALRAYLEDSRQDTFLRSDSSRPVVLGERAMSSGDASIQAVMYDSTAVGDVKPTSPTASPSAVNNEIKAEPFSPQEKPPNTSENAGSSLKDATAEITATQTDPSSDATTEALTHTEDTTAPESSGDDVPQPESSSNPPKARPD